MTRPPRPDFAPRFPEQLVYRCADVRVGTFRCPIGHPDFRTAGQIEGYTIVFPRTAVWIEQENRGRFVAEPRVVVLYNLGQPYTRHPLAADGDRADWFSVGPALAASLAAGVDPDADPTQPFTIGFVSSSGSLYLAQRRLMARLRRGEGDDFLVEQEVVGLMGATMEAAASSRRVPNAIRSHRAARDVAEAARAELARDPTRNLTVREIARHVAMSPFHLCRVFRRHTGSTLHQYLLDLRLRLALERLESSSCDLSRVAFDVGFSSHSHFSSAFRQHLGISPSRARAELTGRRLAPRNRMTATTAA
ncbi:MAG: helix-turn-helix domain-containing protein [Gemmatimonadaceae bacterium]